MLGVGVGRGRWAWALGVGVCVGVGRGRLKQRPKRGWRFFIFFVNFDVVSVRKVNFQFLAQ